jgi:hypothetical protein
MKSEEARCLIKLDKLARRKVSASPGKSYTAAMAEACRQFKITYLHYIQAREELARMGIKPMLLRGLKLGRG